MKLGEIHIRDPYILLHENNYYLYGTRGSECWGLATGLDVYVSENLEDWSIASEVFHRPKGFWADRHFWAPEVHHYRGKFYMFVSFKAENRCRGTQILISDSPKGPFQPLSDEPVTPGDWECLDGTLYIDKNKIPYIVFCHEWLQVSDGEVCALRLTKDLRLPIGKPKLLFKATETPWVKSISNGNGYVTDGPFFYRTKKGTLLMLWASFSGNGYAQAVAVSEQGNLMDKWLHLKKPLFPYNGGHGMIFKTKENKLKLILHSPNDTPMERAVIYDLYERNGRIYRKNNS